MCLIDDWLSPGEVEAKTQEAAHSRSSSRPFWSSRKRELDWAVTHPSSLYLVGALPRERQEWTRAPTNKRQRKGGLGLLSVQVLMRQQPGRGHSSHVITAVMWIKIWTAVTSWETCKERRVFSWTFLYLYSIYILWFKKCPWVYSLTAHPLISSLKQRIKRED